MVFVGNYHGFHTYDIERADKPRLVSSVVCPGGQGDVSVHGHLLIMSVEQTRGRLDCGVQGVQTAVSNERFRGIRIFDISDISRPKQVAAVQTCRGSHTHTLVVDPDDKANVYVYVSGTSTVRSGDEARRLLMHRPEGGSEHLALQHRRDSSAGRDPERGASSVSRACSRIPASAIAGLWRGGNHGEGTQTSRATNQCHDITVFPRSDSRPEPAWQRHPARHPRSEEPGQDRSGGRQEFRVLAFGDVQSRRHEGHLHGRMGRRQPAALPPNRPTDMGRRRDLRRRRSQAALRELLQDAGAADRAGELRGAQRLADPVPGRDIMVQAWYQGGVSIFDFTDSAHPVEIAYFDRGPLDPKQLILGGYWSTYWYNGAICGSRSPAASTCFD